MPSTSFGSAYPYLQRRTVGDALGDVLHDPAVRLALLTAREFYQRVVGLAPARYLADVHLVLAEGSGHPAVDLKEKGSLPDHGRHILGVCTEREVPVAVWR
jgi:hypothetical protein